MPVNRNFIRYDGPKYEGTYLFKNNIAKYRMTEDQICEENKMFVKNTCLIFQNIPRACTMHFCSVITIFPKIKIRMGKVTCRTVCNYV